MRTYIVAALLPLLVAMLVRADESCTGVYDGEVHGGDKEPLTWKSTYRLVKAASGDGNEKAIYQYERTVQNHSNRPVSFVFWDGAGFGKKKIAAGRTICEAVQIASAKTGPSTANLYFNTSSHSYKTTVWAPKDGWGKDVLISSFEGVGDLTSHITFTSTASGAGKQYKGAVVIVSGIKTDKTGKVELQYSFENKSRFPISLELTEATGARSLNLLPGSIVRTSVPSVLTDPLFVKATKVKIIGTKSDLKVESSAQVFTTPTGG